MPSLPLLYTVDEVAANLKVSPRHIRTLTATGKLDSVRIGRLLRIPHEAVMQFLSGDIPVLKARMRAVLETPRLDSSVMRRRKQR